MAWWTRIEREYGSVTVEKHDGRGSKLRAGIALLFAAKMGGVPLEKLGLYRRDPSKYPDEPNMLPDMAKKYAARRTRFTPSR